MPTTTTDTTTTVQEKKLSQIDQMKTKMLEAIYDLITTKSMKQEDAAKFLSITQPRVSNIKNGVIDNFSIDKCIKMLNTFGYNFNFEYTILPFDKIDAEFIVSHDNQNKG